MFASMTIVMTGVWKAIWSGVWNGVGSGLPRGSLRWASMRGSTLPVLALLALLASPAHAKDDWPAAVTARYKLRFQGIDVGTLEFNTTTSGSTYTTSGGAKLAVLFGTFKMKADGAANGSLGGRGPLPKAYAFDWQGGKKKGATRIGFEGQIAKIITVEPPPGAGDQRVPLLEQHKSGALDPVSAVLALTRGGDTKVCEKQVAVFDGKHRFDIAFTPKRTMAIQSKLQAGLAPETATVCRITYRPVAGHKITGETAHFADNTDMEVVLRRVPGTDITVPHAVYIPTRWGTASMVIDRVEVNTRNQGRIALTE